MDARTATENCRKRDQIKAGILDDVYYMKLENLTFSYVPHKGLNEALCTKVAMNALITGMSALLGSSVRAPL
jgi:hypothetical protein